MVLRSVGSVVRALPAHKLVRLRRKQPTSFSIDYALYPSACASLSTLPLPLALALSFFPSRLGTISPWRDARACVVSPSFISLIDKWVRGGGVGMPSLASPSRCEWAGTAGKQSLPFSSVVSRTGTFAVSVEYATNLPSFKVLFMSFSPRSLTRSLTLTLTHIALLQPSSKP